jgi:hypothetical protein
VNKGDNIARRETPAAPLDAHGVGCSLEARRRKGNLVSPIGDIDERPLLALDLETADRAHIETFSLITGSCRLSEGPGQERKAS